MGPRTGTPAGEPLTGHTGWVRSVAFGTALDGRLLVASGSDDRTVRLWDPVTGTQLGELTGHTNTVDSVAFATAPDGRLLLAACSDDDTIRLWDPVTGTQLGKPLTGCSVAVARLPATTGLRRVGPPSLRHYGVAGSSPALRELSLLGGVRDRAGWPSAAGLRQRRPHGAGLGPGDGGVHRNNSAQGPCLVSRGRWRRASNLRRRGHRCNGTESVGNAMIGSNRTPSTRCHAYRCRPTSSSVTGPYLGGCRVSQRFDRRPSCRPPENGGRLALALRGFPEPPTLTSFLGAPSLLARRRGQLCRHRGSWPRRAGARSGAGACRDGSGGGR